ncbi:hypothetical protein SAMN03097699_3217 [Flavobacteriaceae bacterium MAR_2010_188]|nr:hypothetical protein SAMN03097699_3217 [Flavobacteriaceae bacterium MAR_2010_188]
MKTNFILNVLLLTTIVLSCSKEDVSNVTESDSEKIATANLRGGKPNALAVISLKVTVNDAEGNNITSDGKGDYFNGIDYVQAILDQSGTFAFNTFAPPSKVKNAKVTRWVNYNFNNPVDGNTYRPDPSTSENYHFSTGGSVFGTSPFIPLQNLGVNGNPATECIYIGNGISNSTTAWRVSFHKGLEDVSDSPTAFAVVTRTSINPDIWTITPVGACSLYSNVAALRNNATAELYGYYNLPFSFTLEAQ